MAAPQNLSQIGKAVYYALVRREPPSYQLRRPINISNDKRCYDRLSLNAIQALAAVKKPQVHSDHNSVLSTHDIVLNYGELLTANEEFPGTDAMEGFDYNRALSPFYFFKMAMLDYSLRQLQPVGITFVSVDPTPYNGDQAKIITQADQGDREIHIIIERIFYENDEMENDQFKFNTLKFNSQQWNDNMHQKCKINFCIHEQQN